MEKIKAKVYLAGSFTTKKEIEVFNLVERRLREIYEEVYVPRDHVVHNGWHLSNVGWAWEVFKNDRNGIDDCDEIVIINWGSVSGTGTAWEAGYAFASGKPVHMVLVTENNPNKNFSLMMFYGCTTVHTLEGFLGGENEDPELMQLTLK